MDYVVGFMFLDGGLDRVILIRKTKPEWQAGRLNGVGGKIEPGETPAQAMRREFAEETGLDHATWHPFATLTCPEHDSFMHMFRARAGSEYFFSVTSTTEERVETHHVDELILGQGRDCLPNVPWLVAMARSMYFGERADSFQVVET